MFLAETPEKAHCVRCARSFAKAPFPQSHVPLPALELRLALFNEGPNTFLFVVA
jgi:hypothetical protein